MVDGKLFGYLWRSQYKRCGAGESTEVSLLSRFNVYLKGRVDCFARAFVLCVLGFLRREDAEPLREMSANAGGLCSLSLR